jgi:hypothetical protein
VTIVVLLFLNILMRKGSLRERKLNIAIIYYERNSKLADSRHLSFLESSQR